MPNYRCDRNPGRLVPMQLNRQNRGLDVISATGAIEGLESGRNLRLMAGITVDRGCRLALGATGKRSVFAGAIDLNCHGILRGSGHSELGCGWFRWRPDVHRGHALNRVFGKNWPVREWKI